MWKNYLKVAVRNNLRNKVYVVINVTGVIGNIPYNVYEGSRFIPEIYIPGKEE